MKQTNIHLKKKTRTHNKKVLTFEASISCKKKTNGETEPLLRPIYIYEEINIYVK